MPDGYWKQILALFGLTALAALGFGGGHLLGKNQPVDEARETWNTQENQTREDWVTIYDARDATSDHQKIQQKPGDHEQQDLDAQQAMAFWAQAMFWASCGAVFLTALGVVLLWQTLRSTRRATIWAGAGARAAHKTVRETRRIGEAQVRAYVVATSVRAYKVAFRGTDDWFCFTVVVTFRNCGQSPALNVVCRARLILSEQPTFGEINEIADAESQVVLAPTGEHVTEARYPKIFLPGDIRGTANAGQTFWIKGVIESTDIYGGVWENTFAYKVRDLAQFEYGDTTEAGMSPLAEGNSFRAKPKKYGGDRNP